jgi:biofilm PGA synthesis N-glycosyltransferase PgaC
MIVPEAATLEGLSSVDCRLPSAPAIPKVAIFATFAAGLVIGTCVFGLVSFQFFKIGLRHIQQAGGVGFSGGGLIFLGIVSLLTGARWSVLFIISFDTFLRSRARSQVHISHWPFVSIFVPAYNESGTIEAALQSLLELDYPHYEVIVVDDGSKDDTYERARRFAGSHAGCVVRVFRKPNGGKWSAHNFAFARSTGELILCLDADSRIDPDSLRRLVAHMADPNTSGVAGQIRVRNRINLLTRLQALEYLMANGVMRMAQSRSGTVLVVPGPIGLFRRSVLEEVYIRFGQRDEALAEGHVAGPFEADTFAEDFDLSLAVLALGGRIGYEPNAISHTKAPDWPFALLNQRYRWARGTIQVLRKYFRRGFRNRSLFHRRLVIWLTATYLLELLVLPFVYWLGIAFFVHYLLAGYSIVPLLSWTGLFLITNLNSAALFAMMHGDRLSVLSVLPFYDFYHGFLLNCGWFIAVVDEIRGARMRW